MSSLVRLIADGEIDLDVFWPIVPRTAFTILKNHTVGSRPYSEHLRGRMLIQHQPDIYALALSRETLVNLANESREKTQFFSGGLAASDGGEYRVYAIDKNFLYKNRTPVYPKGYSMWKQRDSHEIEGLPISMYAQLTFEQMKFFQGGLVSLNWNYRLPIRKSKRVSPKIWTLEVKAPDGSTYGIASTEDGLVVSDYVPFHHQEVWLGVYGQPLSVSGANRDSPLLSSIASPVKYPKFYPGWGYQKPDPKEIGLNDLNILLVDGIEAIERIFKVVDDYVEKRILFFKKKANAYLERQEIPLTYASDYPDYDEWEKARISADSIIRRQVDADIDVNVFSKLFHIVAAAFLAWEQAQAKSTCDARNLKKLLRKGDVVTRKQADVLSPLIRNCVESPKKPYRKRHDLDPCILATRLRTVLSVAEQLERTRKAGKLSRKEMKAQMENLLGAEKIDAEDASTVLYNILVPAESIR